MQKEKQKKRKGLLILSAFIVSIILLTYWWLNNTWNSNNADKTVAQKEAFNTKLPDANLKETNKNKLEIYMQAEKDSAKLKEDQKKSSLQNKWFNPGPPEDDIYADEYLPEQDTRRSVYSSKNPVDLNEKKVNDKLEKLYAALNNTENAKQSDPFSEHASMNGSDYDNNIKQLENLLQQIQEKDTGSDPEMKEIEALLDKILDIQHPERVKEKQSKNADKPEENVYTVTTNNNSGNTDSLYNSDINHFWGLEDEPLTDSNDLSTILAVVHRNQIVQSHSTVTLRLLQDVYVNSNLIPAGTLISGTCELSADRVQVKLNDIIYNNIIYPISLTVYDTDGLEGIKIWGGTGQDVATNELNQAVQNMQLYSINPSIATQAAATGIQTIKGLLSKKTRKVQATLKADHKLLLKRKNMN